MLPAAPIQIPQNKALGKAKGTELGEDLKDPWRSRTGRGCEVRCPARSTATVLVHQALSSKSPCIVPAAEAMPFPPATGC